MRKIIFVFLIILAVLYFSGNLEKVFNGDLAQRVKSEISAVAQKFPGIGDYFGNYWSGLRDKFQASSASSTLADVPQITKKAVSKLNEIKKEVLPSPLVTAGGNSGTLTRAGIINFTNAERTKDRQKTLSENSTLDAISDIKAKDILDRQYFAHVSPDGKSVADVAKANGYKYIIIGENLALGNFADDAAVVKAWMDSPGHRENILNSRYREIGVGARKGMYEGHEVWVGVQTFGMPSSACPLPDPALKAQIDADEKLLASLEIQASDLRAAIEAMGQRDTAAYNAKVSEYNELVGRVNALIDALKSEVSKYNGQVSASNSCVQG